MCPAVIGGVTVYRDHHLTVTYARTLAPYVQRGLATSARYRAADLTAKKAQ